MRQGQVGTLLWIRPAFSAQLFLHLLFNYSITPMKKWLGFFGIAGVLWLVACGKDTVLPEPQNGGYLPLQVGNYWKLDGLNTRTITETKVFNNNTYFAITTSYDTMYVRKEADKIMAYYRGKTSVLFDLGAKVNDIWMYRDYNVKLISKTDSVKLGSETVKNCYQFFFDIPAMADEEHAIWLAPGIGFIQQACYGECVGGKKKLTEVKLDNKVYRF